MRKRLPNTTFYIDTDDFNYTSTPIETDIEVSDRFVTCTTRNGDGQDQTIKGIKTFDDGICTDLIKVKDTTQDLLKIEHNTVDLTKPIYDPYLQAEYTIDNQIVFGKTCNISYENKKVQSNNIDTYFVKVCCGDEGLNNPRQYSSLCVNSTPQLSGWYQTRTNMTSKGKGSYSSESDNKEFKAEIFTEYWGQSTSTLDYSTKEFAQCYIHVIYNGSEKSYIRMATGRLDSDKYLTIHGERNVTINSDNQISLHSSAIYINSPDSGSISVRKIHGDYDISSDFEPGALYLACPKPSNTNPLDPYNLSNYGVIRICIIYKGNDWNDVYSFLQSNYLYISRGTKLNIGTNFNKVWVDSSGNCYINEDPGQAPYMFELHVDCIFNVNCTLYNSALMQLPTSATYIRDMKDVENRSVISLGLLKFMLPSTADYDSERNYYYKHINEDGVRNGNALTDNSTVSLFVISYGVSLPSE